MRFLITGANGQLGSEWIHFLRDKKKSYTAYGSDQLNITNRARVLDVLERDKPDVVVNCAAYTRVDEAEEKADLALLVNRDGVKNLADCCNLIQAFMIHYSTDYVFPGLSEDQFKYPDGYPENAGRLPVNAYGRSKLAGEKILEEGDFQNWLLIRVAWLCGEYGSNFVKTMLRLSAERKEIGVVDDQLGSPSFTFDVVEKTCFLLENNKSGVYHVSGQGLISWADFAESIFQKAGTETIVKRISSNQFPQKAKRPAFSYLSTKKLQQTNAALLEWGNGLDQLLYRLKNYKTKQI